MPHAKVAHNMRLSLAVSGKMIVLHAQKTSLLF